MDTGESSISIDVPIKSVLVLQGPKLRDAIIGGIGASGSKGGTKASRTPSGRYSAETGEGEECFDTSTDLADLDATSFPSGLSDLNLPPSFKHHVLLDIWRNKFRCKDRDSVTVVDAFDMVDRVIDFPSGVEDTYESIGTAIQSEGGTTSTVVARQYGRKGKQPKVKP
ncbi:hypothetical protein Syun_021111 [Stephania yunnanensis]|uniref:Uncharacterized protein n=1 Tax=Stephania yunnanensis TaxID=152371 RepID=A0AAP0IF20_9MAGN